MMPQNTPQLIQMCAEIRALPVKYRNYYPHKSKKASGPNQEYTVIHPSLTVQAHKGHMTGWPSEISPSMRHRQPLSRTQGSEQAKSAIIVKYPLAVKTYHKSSNKVNSNNPHPRPKKHDCSSKVTLAGERNRHNSKHLGLVPVSQPV